MHIPDSMLSPSTCAVCVAAMAPVWVTAAGHLKHSLKSREVPLLALGAAFCFTIMMFNIPALGGTTAHPVAGTLLAVLLGPWAAVIGISAALAIQALFFGDGGILAFGANCFTMAFALPVVGYAVYLLLTRLLPAASRFRPLCAGVGAFVGINAAASLAAVLLGIQPGLFHEANGHAIYFPFGLTVTLPAMLATHLLIAGPAEAVVTALAVAYLQSASIPLYVTRSQAAATSFNPIRTTQAPKYERLWVAVAALVALTPLGLLASGDAWGEWDASGVQSHIKQISGANYIPKGIASTQAHSYRGVGALSDYGSSHGRSGYLFAALIGATAVIFCLTAAGSILARKDVESVHSADPKPDTNPRTQIGVDGTLPIWLSASVQTPLVLPQRQDPSNRYVARSLADLARRCSAALAGEVWPSAPGLLQRLDARAKLLGIVALMVVVSMSRHLLPIVIVYIAALSVARYSSLPLMPYVRRVWLTVPIFVGGIMVPVILNTVTPGAELITIWLHPHLAVTAPGVHQAVVLVARVGVAVSLAALLALTTRWADLLCAMRSFLVPRVFVDMLAMTYRYAILLMNTAFEIFVARTSRSVGRASNSQGRQFVAAGIGSLFGITLALSEEVHGAMVARGFTGDIRTLRKPVWRVVDTLWFLTAVLTAMAAFVIDRLPGVTV